MINPVHPPPFKKAYYEAKDTTFTKRKMGEL